MERVEDSGGKDERKGKDTRRGGVRMHGGEEALQQRKILINLSALNLTSDTHTHTHTLYTVMQL